MIDPNFLFLVWYSIQFCLLLYLCFIWVHCISVFLSVVDCLIIQSFTIRKTIGERKQLCETPLCIWMGPVTFPSWTTWQPAFSYICWEIEITLSGNLKWCMRFQLISLSTLSKDFVKVYEVSKRVYDDFHHCNMICAGSVLTEACLFLHKYSVQCFLQSIQHDLKRTLLRMEAAWFPSGCGRG